MTEEEKPKEEAEKEEEAEDEGPEIPELLPKAFKQWMLKVFKPLIDSSIILWRGIWKQNPLLVLLLGFSPALALTDSMRSAKFICIMTIITLMSTEFLFSVFKKWIPNNLQRFAAMGISTLVIILLTIYYQQTAPYVIYVLGLALPLTAVSMLVYARTVIFAKNSNPLYSLFDGLGTGLGFSVIVLLITWVRIALGGFFPYFLSPSGALAVVALIFAFVQWKKTFSIRVLFASLKKKEAKQ